MKLETQFTVLKKDKAELCYTKKMQTLEKTLKLNFKDYTSKANNQVYSY